MPTIWETIRLNPVGDINSIIFCPYIKAFTKTFFEQLTWSHKGEKIGIDKTANPVPFWIKNPKIIYSQGNLFSRLIGNNFF